MRADRLISLLLLLQTSGRMTAASLAEELGVSIRTIYRDLDALSLAGIPVYAGKGPGGGCALVDSYRSTLTGLTEAEVRAILLVSIPGPLAELGLGDELRAATLKLAAARPGQAAGAVRGVYLDWSAWRQTLEPAPALQTLYRGISEGRCAWLALRLERGQRIEQVVRPYGLVAKAGRWYLVAAREGELRVYRLARLEGVRLLEERFAIPPDFDLERFWKEWRSGVEDNQPVYRVTARVSPGLMPYLGQIPGLGAGRPAGGQAVDEEGWSRVELTFDSFEEARARLLGLGGAIEVLAPLSLRLSVADFARQAARLYE